MLNRELIEIPQMYFPPGCILMIELYATYKFIIQSKCSPLW